MINPPFYSHHPGIPSPLLVIKSINHEENYDSKCLFFYWMTMRIFIFIPRADWCGCNLPLQSVNIPVFVAVVQTSIVVYSMLHQNTEREGRD